MLIEPERVAVKGPAVDDIIVAHVGHEIAGIADLPGLQRVHATLGDPRPGARPVPRLGGPNVIFREEAGAGDDHCNAAQQHENTQILHTLTDSNLAKLARLVAQFSNRR